MNQFAIEGDDSSSADVQYTAKLGHSSGGSWTDSASNDVDVDGDSDSCASNQFDRGGLMPHKLLGIGSSTLYRLYWN